MTIADSHVHFRFAFALVVLKSKPNGVTVEEYIHSLRHSLLHTSGTGTGADSFIDSATLWHSLFIQIQRNSLALRGELAIPRNDESADSDAPSTPRKRKHQASRTAKEANTQSKRLKTADVAHLAAEEQETSTIEQHPDRALVLRIIYGLARTKDKLPSDDERKDSIVHLACDTVIETCQNAQDGTTLKTASQSQPVTLNEACIAAKRIWSILLVKLSRHTISSEEADDHLFTVNSSICSVIETLLSRLHQYCLDEADRRTKSLRKSTKAQKANAKAALKNDKERVELFEHNCGVVASTLAHMLAVAVNLQQTRQGLFEAIASVFLEHLGSAMSLQLFGFPESSDNGNSLAPPHGMQDVSHIGVKDALLTTQLEAPYLISILKGLMRSDASNSNVTMSGNLSDDTPSTSIGPVILQKLQSRLVRGIFGDELGLGADSISINKRLPVMVTTESQTNHNDTSNENDWFLSQVWELIGWDILLGGNDDMKLAGNADT